MTLSKAVQLSRRQAREQRTQQKVEQVRPCIEDGWPLKEIYRTHKTSARFVRKWFPDYKGLPHQECGSLSMAIQGRKIKK